MYLGGNRRWVPLNQGSAISSPSQNVTFSATFSKTPELTQPPLQGLSVAVPFSGDSCTADFIFIIYRQQTSSESGQRQLVLKN